MARPAAHGPGGAPEPGAHRDRIASPGPGVNPITFSDDGRLFVSQCALGDHLFELDPDRQRGAAPHHRPARSGLTALNGMDWGPDDRLYGPGPAASEGLAA